MAAPSGEAQVGKPAPQWMRLRRMRRLGSLHNKRADTGVRPYRRGWTRGLALANRAHGTSRNFGDAARSSAGFHVSPTVWMTMPLRVLGVPREEPATMTIR